MKISKKHLTQFAHERNVQGVESNTNLGANMTALDFIRAHAIRSREVLEFVLKNEIAQIGEKHAQYDTLCATAKEMENTGQYELAKVCMETASGVLADLSLIQAMCAYVLTSDAAGVSSADVEAIESLPYLKK